MKPHIFREYDIRGVVGTEFILEEVYNLTKAIVTYFLSQNPQAKTVVVGMDGRTHSPAIKAAMIMAITEMGLDVIDIGICPTPIMYFALHNIPCDAGLMITASHNPKEYNGIKICLGKQSVWGKQVQEIRQIYQTQNFARNVGGVTGHVTTHDMITDYIAWMEKSFPHLIGNPIHAVVDCGNAVGGAVIPQLIETMKWQNVTALCAEVDGNFPNHPADPTVRKNMQCVADALARDPQLEIGLGLDGDCDRMNPFTKSGELVAGDKLLAIFSKQVLAKIPGAHVVCDIKGSSALFDLIQQWGGALHVSPSGHSIIKKEMARCNALLAGELSCHFFFHDRYFGYDDGIYAMLRLFEILHETNQSLDKLLTVFPPMFSSPEIRVACAEEQKVALIEQVHNFFEHKSIKELITIDGVRVHTDYGWGLARASNTQPVVCFRFESETQDGLQKITNDFLEAIQPYYDADVFEQTTH